MTEERLKTYTLITVTVTSFLSPFAASALNLAIPIIGEQMHGSALLLSWVVSGYVLATAAFLIPLGRLADITGRRKVFIWGQGIFTITSLLCALARSITVLIIARCIEGLAAAAMFGTSLAILSAVFPPGERGKVLGINVGTVYAGLSLGPSLGGILTHHLGWEYIFIFTTIVAAANFILSNQIMRRLEPEKIKSEPYEFTSAIMYTAGIIALLYGVSSIAASHLSRFIMPAGLAALIVFVLVELKADYPLLNLRLFKNITFAFSNLAALINYSATYAVGFIFSLYLQVARGYDAQAAGLILLVQPAVQAMLSPYAGALSDRVDSRTLASLGMGVTTLGLLVFSFISPHFPIWLLVANLALLGIGFGFFSSPNSNAVMSAVDQRFYGVASSTLATMRTAGQALSMAMVALIISLHVGDALLTPALADEFVEIARTACLVFAVICGVGIFASLARGKTINNSASPAGRNPAGK
ncbi:MAG: MFS transporter [Firmicutes bacterium]|nr:MFS transporter [Bacillota bacterium]